MHQALCGQVVTAVYRVAPLGVNPCGRLRPQRHGALGGVVAVAVRSGTDLLGGLLHDQLLQHYRDCVADQIDAATGMEEG